MLTIELLLHIDVVISILIRSVMITLVINLVVPIDTPKDVSLHGKNVAFKTAVLINMIRL